MVRSTNVRDWDGLPIREVQLGDGIDINDQQQVAAALNRSLEEKERLARGELKKVKKVKDPSSGAPGMNANFN